MFDSVDEELINGVKATLGNLKILKYLNDCGYKLGTTSYYLGSHDDAYAIQEEFMETVMNLVCGANTWDWDHATEEHGKKLGYDMMYSEDELTVTQVILQAPVIVEYLKWLQEYELKSEDCNELHNIVGELVTPPAGWGDYQVYESFVAKDYSGIVMLFTDYDYVSFEFAEHLMEVMDFCKKNIERKKEGERLYAEPIGA